MTIIDLKTMREICPPPASVLCLGNFDGVHIGHAALIRETVARCDNLRKIQPDIVSGACFFRTPPADFFSQSPTPQLITVKQKLALFSEMGLDIAVIIDFESVGNLSPESFVKQILQKQINCKYAVCGFNYTFGRHAAGNASTLFTLFGGEVTVVRAVESTFGIVSSSSIRKMIAEGQVHLVHKLLGRPFSLNAEVCHGKALGRTIGVPTVNQFFPDNLMIPKPGIYITQTVFNHKRFPSVSNVGVRPSVEVGAKINCETHILDFDGDLYGQSVEVLFCKRLRDEFHFDSLEALQDQIQHDIQQTRKYHGGK